MTTPPRWPYADLADAAFDGAIAQFADEHRFLSNFVGAVEMYGLTFRCPEIAFAAAKMAAPAPGRASAWLLGLYQSMPDSVRATPLAHIAQAFDRALPSPDDGALALHLGRVLFSKIAEPGDAKKIGRRITLRADWESQRPDGLLEKEWILLTLNRRKYARDPELARKLLATGERLILEGNAWNDTAWGVVEKPTGLVGWNRMGAIAMAVREELGGAGVPDTASPHMPRFAHRGL